jgi:hypothetical protein
MKRITKRIIASAAVVLGSVLLALILIVLLDYKLPPPKPKYSPWLQFVLPIKDKYYSADYYDRDRHIGMADGIVRIPPDIVLTMRPCERFGLEWIVPEGFTHRNPNLIFIRPDPDSKLRTRFTIFTSSIRKSSIIFDFNLDAPSSYHIWRRDTKKKGFRDGDKLRFIMGLEDAEYQRGYMKYLYCVVDVIVKDTEHDG